MVFAIFAVCVLLVLLTGADVYRKLVESQKQYYDRRTVQQYLSMRVHQADVAGAVRVDMFEDRSALIFSEEIQGSLYETCVYCHDGYVRELFTAAGGEFGLEDGEKVLAAKDLLFMLDGKILTIEIFLEDGQEQHLTFLLRSGEEDSYEQ